MRPQSRSRAMLWLLALSAGAPFPATGQQAWRTSVTKDEITDQMHYLLMLSAANTTLGPLRAAYRPSLYLRCVAGKVEAAFVNTGVVLESGQVEVRWDSLPARTEGWLRSDDMTASFADSPDQVLTALAAHRVLLVRFYPHAGSYQTARFLLPRLAAHNRAIGQYCGRDLAAEARQQEADRQALLNQVGKVELVVPLAQPVMVPVGGSLALRPMVRVWRRNGKPATAFQLGTIAVVVAEGYSFGTRGDTLSLGAPGTYQVTITADDVPADTTFELTVTP